MTEAKFPAQIYDIKTRTTKSSDKTTRITLEQDNLSVEVLNKLNELVNSSQNEWRGLTIIIREGDVYDEG